MTRVQRGHPQIVEYVEVSRIGIERTGKRGLRLVIDLASGINRASGKMHPPIAPRLAVKRFSDLTCLPALSIQAKGARPQFEHARIVALGESMQIGQRLPALFLLHAHPRQLQIGVRMLRIDSHRLQVKFAGAAPVAAGHVMVGGIIE